MSDNIKRYLLSLNGRQVDQRPEVYEYDTWDEVLHHLKRRGDRLANNRFGGTYWRRVLQSPWMRRDCTRNTGGVVVAQDYTGHIIEVLVHFAVIDMRPALANKDAS